MKKVLVVGLGQLGFPVAKYIHDAASAKGFEVYGYDIKEAAMDHAWRSAGIMKANDFSGFDVYNICIATHRPDDINLPDTVGIFSIVDRISKEGRSGALVSIESTVPKGTTRKVTEILGHRMHVVHAPHRWYVHEEKDHGVNQLRVIGGVHDCCLKEGLKFYAKDSHQTAGNLGIPMHPVSNVELAELAKLIENSHRYLQIAFAEDLFLYCSANKINFWELRATLNTKWNVHILEPRDGIGGHCLPKDTKMFIQASDSKVLSAAMEVDSDYRKELYRQNVWQEGVPTIAKATSSKPIFASET